MGWGDSFLYWSASVYLAGLLDRSSILRTNGVQRILTVQTNVPFAISAEVYRVEYAHGTVIRRLFARKRKKYNFYYVFVYVSKRRIGKTNFILKEMRFEKKIHPN